MRFVIIILLFFLTQKIIYAQGCCSGGSGSPIAGGVSQGVLQKEQLEIATNYQYLKSNKFMAKDIDTIPMLDNLFSNYIYFRTAYGITDKFTMSIESGYFINKTQIELQKADTITSSGFGDLILFPRYNVFTHKTELTHNEITLGLGYKMPIGKYNDSNLVFTDPYSNKKYYTTSPPTIQPTTGSQDFVFYGFLARSYTTKQFKLFSNLMYIKKGWNPMGQKFGDYASVGLFVYKSFFCKLAFTLQFRGEYVAKMKYDNNIDMLALYNIDVRSTGSKKVIVSPQVSYTFNSLTLYGLYEYPIYQYVNGVQIASQHNLTFGLAYRFFVKKQDSNISNIPTTDLNYQCPMKCEGSGKNEPGKCKTCGMKLIKNK